MVLFRCEIIVEKHKSKKNNKSAFFSKRLGKAWVTRSLESIKAQDDLETKLAIEKRRQLNNAVIVGDIQITLLFRFSDFYTKKGVRNKKLPDLDNLLCLPLDALTKSRVIDDDQNVCSLDGSRRLPGERNSIEIIISDFR